MLTLFTYFRSAASYRVRIALALKGLGFGAIPIHLVRDGGRQHSQEFLALNPSGLVPVLMDGPHTLMQSMAILEYLEEQYPQSPLLPKGFAERARVRGIAQMIACDIHPLNNLRVLTRLGTQFHADADAKASWYRHWIELGFEALERMLMGSPSTGLFCHGDSPTMADCCLVPQVFNAKRFDIEMTAYPLLQKIAGRCEELPAFQRAAPANQGDAE